MLQGGNRAEVVFEEVSGVLQKTMVWNVKHHSGFKAEGLTLQPLFTYIPSMTFHESKLEKSAPFCTELCPKELNTPLFWQKEMGNTDSLLNFVYPASS